MLDILKNKIKYIARIPVSLLNVDYTYQKPLSMAHARKIAKNFNPQGVGQIHVSKRDDGSYYIFDGQHRWTAYEMLELEVIECIVYEGMTIKEEAEAYNLYNTIKTQNALDREKALLVAGDKDAALRKATVEELGLEIDYDRTNHNDKIQAVGAVVEIYNKFGVDGLHNVLSII